MKVPELSETELRDRLRQHEQDRLHKESTLAAYTGAMQQTSLIRSSIADRLESLKWIAAISTAALFVVGRSVDPSGSDPIHASANAWKLGAELSFLLSAFGAGGFILVVDRRAAEWLRDVHRIAFSVTSQLLRIDAVVGEIREAVDQKRLGEANRLFRESVQERLVLGQMVKSPPPKLQGETGWSRIYASGCVGGLLTGIALLMLDQGLRLVS